MTARRRAATTSLPDRCMASRITRRRRKTVAALAGISMALFAGAHHVFQPSTFRNLVISALLGLTLGALAAPAFEPKLFPSPERWQAAAGAVGGALLALLAGASPQVIATAAVTGAVLGALANYWVKYV